MQQAPIRTEDPLAFLTTLTMEKQTGEVLFQYSGDSAKVYLQQGLILWAFATGQNESFQSILIRENYISKEDLLKGIKEARQNGKRSLDEILKSLNIGDADTREDIIRRHTKAALEIICSWQDCIAQFNESEPDANGQLIGLPLSSLLGQEQEVSSPAPAKAEQAAPEVSSIQEVLEHFQMNIPQFLACMLIDSATGMPIATLSDAHDFDVETVSAFYRDLSKSALDALEAMGKSGDAPLEEVLITSVDEYVLLRSINKGEQLLYLLIDKQANPAMARLILKKFIEPLTFLPSVRLASDLIVLAKTRMA